MEMVRKFIENKDSHQLQYFFLNFLGLAIVNTVDASGSTLLHYAAFFGNLEVYF
jgi:hypothetical protein